MLLLFKRTRAFMFNIIKSSRVVYQYIFPVRGNDVLKVHIHNYYKGILFTLFRVLSTFCNSDMLLIKETDKETNGLSDFHWGTIQPAIDCGTRDTCSFRIHFHFQEERKKKRCGNIAPPHEYAET